MVLVTARGGLRVRAGRPCLSEKAQARPGAGLPRPFTGAGLEWRAGPPCVAPAFADRDSGGGWEDVGRGLGRRLGRGLGKRLGRGLGRGEPRPPQPSAGTAVSVSLKSKGTPLH